jgi:hypothetical protein
MPLDVKTCNGADMALKSSEIAAVRRLPRNDETQRGGFRAERGGEP